MLPPDRWAFFPEVVSHFNLFFWEVLYFLIKKVIFLFMDFSPQIWTCDLRSWGDLMGHPQEASGLWKRIPWPTKLVCIFQMPIHDQHFNQETTTRLGSSWPPYAQRKAGSAPLHPPGSHLYSLWLSKHYSTLENDHIGSWTPVHVLRLLLAVRVKSKGIIS